ncbi:MAG: carboxypeptidase-like regulatory domain-containing protein [Flavobacteriales bacterium]|nr:carboxypeptidase-like regulatory domain-containing protein [Flavobacteriales bacterium]
MIGANVYVKETMRGGATNTYGYYVLNVPAGKHTVVMSFIGYEDNVQVVEASADMKFNIVASPIAIQVQEFEVVGERKANTEDTRHGNGGPRCAETADPARALGEVDILKTIQFLPGVQSNGEGNAGLCARRRAGPEPHPAG